MGPQPSALHGREVGWEAFGVQRSPQSSLTSGSYQRGDRVGCRGGWESEEEDPKKGDRWGRKNKRQSGTK